MELRVLNYFLVVAREENITRAASQLHITQPTLSRQLAQLEEELGVTLFHRKNHSISLTEEGMILRRRAQEIMSLADKTKQEFVTGAQELEGTVSIGCGEYQSTGILTDCIASFRKLHPHVRFELYSGNTGNINDMIKRGLLDMGLISVTPDVQKFEYMRMPVEEQWGLLVRNDSELADQKEIHPEDLLRIPLVLPEGIMREDFSNWIGPCQSQLDVVATGNLQYNESLLAYSNVGAVVGIRLEYELKNLTFIPFSPAMYMPTWVVWKKDEVFPLVHRSFISYVKQYIDQLTDLKQS